MRPVFIFLCLITTVSCFAKIRNFLFHGEVFFQQEVESLSMPLEMDLVKVYHKGIDLKQVSPGEEDQFYENRILFEQKYLDEALDYFRKSYRGIKKNLDKDHHFKAFGLYLGSVNFSQLDRNLGAEGVVTVPGKAFVDRKSRSLNIALKYDDSIKKWIPYHDGQIVYKVQVTLDKSSEEVFNLKPDLSLLKNHPRIDSYNIEYFSCDKVIDYYKELTGPYDHNDSLPLEVINNCKDTDTYQQLCNKLISGEIFTGSDLFANSCGITTQESLYNYFLNSGDLIIE